VGLIPRTDILRCSLEVGYWLAEPLWGRGLVPEAVGAVVDYAFATFPEVTVVVAHHLASNPASGRVLEKCGFRLDGRLRQAAVKEGVVQDLVLYSRTRATPPDEGERCGPASGLASDEPRSFEVRPIAEGDVAAFRETLDAVCRERRYLAFLEAPSQEECTAFVRDHIARRTTQFVAVEGGRLIGWCDVVPMSRTLSRHCGVLGIGVLSGFRGRGVGMALMRAALQGAREYGLTRVELTVRAHNTAAMRLYERLGFAHEGVKRNAVLLDGRHEDLVCMALLLDSPADPRSPRSS
jgi:RimJ/RimL family protein N-acetyltransferase